MKTENRDLLKGLVLLLGFIIILIMLFTPMINGQKPITYLDDLYNSISKGSVYYIPGLQKQVTAFEEKEVEFTVGFSTLEQADQMAQLFSRAGNQVQKSENELVVKGNLGKLMATSLADADSMFQNKGTVLADTYGFGERNVLYYWWLGLKALDKQLIKEHRFEEAKFVNSVNTRGVECSFNYYGIEPKKISTEVLFVVASLAFYVIYTLWFGFAILYIFVGFGLKLEH